MLTYLMNEKHSGGMGKSLLLPVKKYLALTRLVAS